MRSGGTWCKVAACGISSAAVDGEEAVRMFIYDIGDDVLLYTVMKIVHCSNCEDVVLKYSCKLQGSNQECGQKSKVDKWFIIVTIIFPAEYSP